MLPQCFCFHRTRPYALRIHISAQKYLRILLLLLPGLAATQPPESELAKQLANPIASLISVPFLFNYDRNIGPVDEGERPTHNTQPVIRFGLNKEWNLISRTILPVIRQTDVASGLGSQSGIGDIVQSLFSHPLQQPRAAGFGVPNGILLPTGSDDRLASYSWGIGPTAVALQQFGAWTYSALARHI